MDSNKCFSLEVSVEDSDRNPASVTVYDRCSGCEVARGTTEATCRCAQDVSTVTFSLPEGEYRVNCRKCGRCEAQMNKWTDLRCDRSLYFIFNRSDIRRIVC